MSLSPRRLATALSVPIVAAVVALTGTAPAFATGLSDLIGTDSYTEMGQVDVSQAKNLLSQVRVADNENTSRYDSTLFGDRWLDPDGNKCDARNDILARDLTSITYRDGSDCIVQSGTLNDPFTGKTIKFTRGVETSTDVQIDHMVPRSYAWRHGAEAWDKTQREKFANDPINLTAVDGPTNGAKSDNGPGDWMVPNAKYTCTYVARFTYVLSEYKLSVSQVDKDAITKTLDSCVNPKTKETATPTPTEPDTPTETPTKSASPTDTAFPPHSVSPTDAPTETDTPETNTPETDVPATGAPVDPTDNTDDSRKGRLPRTGANSIGFAVATAFGLLAVGAVAVALVGRMNSTSTK